MDSVRHLFLKRHFKKSPAAKPTLSWPLVTYKDSSLKGGWDSLQNIEVFLEEEPQPVYSDAYSDSLRRNSTKSLSTISSLVDIFPPDSGYDISLDNNDTIDQLSSESSTYISGADYSNATIYGNSDDIGLLNNLVTSVPIGVCLYTLSALTLVGNAMVLHAIRTERRLQTVFAFQFLDCGNGSSNRRSSVSNMFIMSLAIADLTVGLIVMPISSTYVLTGDWRFGLIVCQFWLSADYSASTASILNLLILSLDRYWSVKSPLKYIRKRTKRRALAMIAVVWLVSGLWILPIIGWHWWANEGGERKQPSEVCETEFADNVLFKVTTSTANFYVPMILMIAVYLKIYLEIKKRSQFEIGQCNVGGSRVCRSESSTPNHSGSGKWVGSRSEGGESHCKLGRYTSSLNSNAAINDREVKKYDQSHQREEDGSSKKGPKFKFKSKLIKNGRSTNDRLVVSTSPSCSLLSTSNKEMQLKDDSSKQCRTYPVTKSFLKHRTNESPTNDQLRCVICYQKNNSANDVLSAEISSKNHCLVQNSCMTSHSLSLNDIWRCDICGMTGKNSLYLGHGQDGTRSNKRRCDNMNACQHLLKASVGELKVDLQDQCKSTSPNDCNVRSLSICLKTEDVVVFANKRGECSGSTLSLTNNVKPRRWSLRGWFSRKRMASTSYNQRSANGEAELEDSDSLSSGLLKKKSSRKKNKKVAEDGDISPIEGSSSDKNSSGHLQVPLQVFNTGSFKRNSSTRRSSRILSNFSTFKIKASGRRNTGSATNLRQEKKAARQLGVIMGAFVLCWLPYIVIFIVTACCEHCLNPVIHTIAIWLGYFNSTINPLIYALCNASFKRAFWKICGRLSSSPKGSNASKNNMLYNAVKPNIKARTENNMFA